MAQVDSETSTAMPGDSPGGLYIPTDITPEQLFLAIGKLRREARDEIERLLNFLDETDNHMELEEAVDDVACDDNELDGSNVDGQGEDDEPSLGTIEVNLELGDGYAMTRHIDQTAKQGNRDDCEGDGCFDDREHDPADGPEETNEDGDGNPDDEPSLGWGLNGEKGNISGDDREDGGHAARPQDRTDLGLGVHAAPNYCHGNRILGLTAEQAARLRSKRMTGGVD